MKSLLRKFMLGTFAAVLCAGASVRAADTTIKLTRSDNHIDVTVGSKPFTTYWFGAHDRPYIRPFFWPVMAAGDVVVTSDQYSYKKDHPKADHPHHQSFWVGHGDVNGADQWALEKGADNPKQRHLGFAKVDADGFVENLEWEGKDHQPILKEVRTVKFVGLADGSRAVDMTSAFTPIDGPVTFGDTKESGIVAVRMATEIVANKPQLTNAKGQTGEKATWGKPADWCDESGMIGGKPFGIAIFDHPDNPRHPATWHVREYGLMSSNIFGLHDFDKANPPHTGDLTIEKGKTVTWKHRVLIHTGLAADAGLDQKYKDYAVK